MIAALGGSLRANSYSRAALHAALEIAEAHNVATELLDVRTLSHDPPQLGQKGISAGVGGIVAGGGVSCWLLELIGPATIYTILSRFPSIWRKYSQHLVVISRQDEFATTPIPSCFGIQLSYSSDPTMA